jgi:hypothetical protein
MLYPEKQQLINKTPAKELLSESATEILDFHPCYLKEMRSYAFRSNKKNFKGREKENANVEK